MTVPQETFVDLCIKGKVSISDIDDFVDRWHDGNDPHTLHEFLGLTEGEYALWVKRPSELKIILSARKNGVAIN